MPQINTNKSNVIVNLQCFLIKRINIDSNVNLQCVFSVVNNWWSYSPPVLAGGFPLDLFHAPNKSNVIVNLESRCVFSVVSSWWSYSPPVLAGGFPADWSANRWLSSNVCARQRRKLLPWKNLRFVSNKIFKFLWVSSPILCNSFRSIHRKKRKLR